MIKLHKTELMSRNCCWLLTLLHAGVDEKVSEALHMWACWGGRLSGAVREVNAAKKSSKFDMVTNLSLFLRLCLYLTLIKRVGWDRLKGLGQQRNLNRVFLTGRIRYNILRSVQQHEGSGQHGGVFGSGLNNRGVRCNILGGLWSSVAPDSSRHTGQDTVEYTVLLITYDPLRQREEARTKTQTQAEDTQPQFTCGGWTDECDVHIFTFGSFGSNLCVREACLASRRAVTDEAGATQLYLPKNTSRLKQT